MRVIEIFQSQIAERDFNIYALRLQVDSIISSELYRYSQIAVDLNNQASTIHGTLEAKNTKLFNSKYSVLTKEFKESVNICTDVVKKVDQQIEAELFPIKSDIRSLKEQTEEQIQEFNAYYQKMNQELQDSINEMNKQHDIDLNHFDLEMDDKLRILKSKSSQNMQLLQERHRMEIKNIRIENQERLDPEIQKNNEFLSYKMQEIRQEIQEVLVSVPQILEKTKLNIINSKSCSKEIIKEMKNTKDRFTKEKQRIIGQIDSYNDKYLEIINNSTQENAKRKLGHEREIEKIESELNKLQENNKEQYLARKRELDKFYSSFSSEFDEIMGKLQTELISRNKTIREEENKLAEHIQNLNDQIKESEATFGHFKAESMSHLESKKQELQRERTCLMTMNEKNISQLITEYSDKFREIESKINALNKEKNSEYMEKEAEFQEMKMIFDQITEANQKEIDDYQLKTQEGINVLTNQYIKQAETLGKQFDEDIAKLQNECDEEIERTRKELLHKRELYKMSIFKANDTQIRAIKPTTGEYHSILCTYQGEYDEEQQRLAQITPMSSNNNIIQELNDQIESLITEKAQKIRNYANQRHSIEGHWGIEIESDIMRHKAKIAQTASGRNRDQVKQSLHQQILDLMRLRGKEEQEKKDYLSKIMSDFRVEMEVLKAKLADVKSTTEIFSMQHKYEMIKTNSERSINVAISNKEVEINHVKCVNNDRRALYERELIDLKLELENSKTNYVDELAYYKAKLVDIQNWLAEELENQKQTVKDKINESKANYEQSKSDLANEIEALNYLIREYKKKMIQEIDDFSTEKEMALNQQEEINREENTKQHKKLLSLKEFYEDRILILKKKLEAAIESYNERTSRISELEYIEKLEIKSNACLMQLRNGAKDLVTYKKLLVQKEYEYNAFFGRNPSVGVLILSSGNGQKY